MKRCKDCGSYYISMQKKYMASSSTAAQLLSWIASLKGIPLGGNFMGAQDFHTRPRCMKCGSWNVVVPPPVVVRRGDDYEVWEDGSKVYKPLDSGSSCSVFLFGVAGFFVLVLWVLTR